MTQNLALDLGTGSDPNLKYVAKLTPSDSDVSEEWVPRVSTNAYDFDYSNFEQELFDFNSWNLGKAVISAPLEVLSSVDEMCALSSEALGYIDGKFTVNPGVACRKFGLTDVSDSEWQPTFNSQTGTFNGNVYDLVSVDEKIHTYDAHYLLGNYYQFSTATAGSLDTPYSNNTSATHSICPKGWQLPNNNMTNDFKPLGNDKGFYDLLLAYGYPSSNSWDNAQTPIINSGLSSEANPLAPPMYFTAGGDVSIIDMSFYGAGSIAESWSGTTVQISGSNPVRPSNIFVDMALSRIQINAEAHNSAFNVRCLAR